MHISTWKIKGNLEKLTILGPENICIIHKMDFPRDILIEGIILGLARNLDLDLEKFPEIDKDDPR